MSKLNPEIVRVICSYDAKVYTPQIDGFTIVPIEPDAKIRVTFKDCNEYLLITENTLPLFCNNHYYGGILVRDTLNPAGQCVRKSIRTFYIRATAAVLSNSAGERILTPIAQNADIIWDCEFDADGLSRHFSQEYARLREKNPGTFCENLSELLSAKLRIVLSGAHAKFQLD